MDHRWDESIRRENAARAERERYGAERVADDADVRRRDMRAAPRQRAQMSPWEIGAAHWDQRDLYTRNKETDDRGYGRGPAMHPEEGSYAYHRDLHEPEVPSVRGRELYAREAYPIVMYEPNAAHVPSYAGERGPKNWKRSDARIHDDVCQALTDHPAVDASDIEVVVKEGEVTLSGTVSDRQSKRLAEDVADQCAGVVDVHNKLTVRPADDGTAPGGFVVPVTAM